MVAIATIISRLSTTLLESNRNTSKTTSFWAVIDIHFWAERETYSTHGRCSHRPWPFSPVSPAALLALAARAAGGPWAIASLAAHNLWQQLGAQPCWMRFGPGIRASKKHQINIPHIYMCICMHTFHISLYLYNHLLYIFLVA